MTYHILRNKNGYKLSPIVHRKGDADHLRDDGGTSRPRFYHLITPCLLRNQNFSHQLIINKWPFF